MPAENSIHDIEAKAVHELRERLLSTLDKLNLGECTPQHAHAVALLAKRVTDNVRAQVDAVRAGMKLGG